MGLYGGLLDVLGLPKCILLSKHIAMKHETLTHWFFTLLFLHELVVSKIEQGYASDVKDEEIKIYVAMYLEMFIFEGNITCPSNFILQN